MRSLEVYGASLLLRAIDMFSHKDLQKINRIETIFLNKILNVCQKRLQLV